MNEAGARSLTAAIVKQAFDDLDDLYLRVMNIRVNCNRIGICRFLVNRKKQIAQKKPVKPLPFHRTDDMTAMKFFRNKWGKSLMDGAGLNTDNLPPEITSKLEIVESYHRHCVSCVKDALEKIKSDSV